MKIDSTKYDNALRDLVQLYCHKILYVDITADKFEVIQIGDYEWETKSKELPTDKISEWFNWFADSPFCHENDRKRFKDFTDLDSLKALFTKTEYKAASIVYRRRFDLSEQIYSTVKMELLPSLDENGHIVAYVLVRNITAEIQKYNESLEQNLDVSRESNGQRTVLVVEDNDMNREILTEILSETYKVLQAENGAIGLELLQKHMTEISLVVLDVQMPVMNGYEFLEHVQKDPFLSKIPIVVATGSDSIEEENKCLKLGASDFVTKPYNPEIIMSRIAGMIRLRESATTMTMLQTDERTGLYTLQAFYYYTRLVLDKNPNKAYTITILDVDHFKTINETYGEVAGDRVLQQIAGVIKDYTAASDINGRFGAARFLLLSETMTAEKTDVWINGLFNSLQTACGIKGISFKAGIYDDVDKALQISSICDRAITALNSCGQNYKNRYSMYDEAHAETERRLAAMEADMQDAYNNEEFSVYYQPKHEAATGKLIGAEALIRWIHPRFGFLSPAEFIPLFERNGFVSYADYYVLKRTCKNLSTWIKDGINPVPISVNASRIDFEKDNYLETVMKPLNDNGINPELIHIEVTESLFSSRMEEISRVLSECRNSGFEIELDDFGSGYSSLTTLASLPLDVMKLDMSFMRNFEDEKKRKVLATCISLAKNLGLKTVAEGVETEAQLEVLKQYGCDRIQGYYFSKPLPESEFKEYLIKYTK